MAVGAGPEVAPGQAIVRDGFGTATAAASCWDIKQRNPEAAGGAYCEDPRDGSPRPVLL